MENSANPTGSSDSGPRKPSGSASPHDYSVTAKVRQARHQGRLIVVVTGSREWQNHRPMEARFSLLPRDVLLIQGGARGADRLAQKLGTRQGLEVLEMPADWGRWGKAAGGLRNQAMIDLGPDLLLAFPMSESRGTWDCVRRAQRAGIRIEIFAPTGRLAQQVLIPAMINLSARQK